VILVQIRLIGVNEHGFPFALSTVQAMISRNSSRRAMIRSNSAKGLTRRKTKEEETNPQSQTSH
jgi:hypothetical protein